MKRTIFFSCIISFYIGAQAQKLQGSLYEKNYNHSEKINYNRKFEPITGTDSIYITTYKLYNKMDSLIKIISLENHKNKKELDVSVKKVENGIITNTVYNAIFLYENKEEFGETSDGKQNGNLSIFQYGAIPVNCYAYFYSKTLKEYAVIRTIRISKIGELNNFYFEPNNEDNSNNKSQTLNTNESVKDIDGNLYKTINIGTQKWIAENLKTTKYNDSTTIPLVTDNTSWSKLTTPGYCYYNNDASTYKNTYGILYNWYVVNTDKICPTGWHIPKYDEWLTLFNFLGGENLAAGKMFEPGTSHCTTSNNISDNSSGFTALPSGCRIYNNGTFNYIGSYTGFWSSTESDPDNAWRAYLCCDRTKIYLVGRPKTSGFSIRCIKDL